MPPSPFPAIALRPLAAALLAGTLFVIGCAPAKRAVREPAASPTSAPASAPASAPTSAPVSRAVGTMGVVATVHPLATEAGADAFRRGGNAIDAAVAAALTLGVVDGHNSGIGGGCFLLIRKADGTILAIDGRETAPALATRDMFLRDGKADPRLSTVGALAIGIPGSLAAYDHALRNGGKLPLADHLQPGLRLAERGFPIDALYAQRLAEKSADLVPRWHGGFDPDAAKIFLTSTGSPWPAGHVLKQPDLARTYRAIAEEGVDWFYKGDFAKAAGGWCVRHGGVAFPRDFQDYRIVLREPLRTTYRGLTIVGFPPPSSGGVHVGQILNILESFDLKSMDPATRTHVIAEAMRLAFADRAFWLGDPAFAKVPRGLVDKAYAAELAKRIDVSKAIDVAGPGAPPAAEADTFDAAMRKHTTHVAAADAEGNWVALTTTLNTSFGSRAVIPGTGVLMNNQMDDFSIQPGVPNAFGLVGAEANAVAPGKRPLSSMSPTIVLDAAGRPLFTCGAAGGPTIISQVVQTIVNHVDLGLPLDEAVAAPRVHHQWRPNALMVETGLDRQIVAALRARGHAIEVRERIAAGQAAGRDAGDALVGVADPRVGGKAIGVDGEK